MVQCWFAVYSRLGTDNECGQKTVQILSVLAHFHTFPKACMQICWTGPYPAEPLAGGLAHWNCIEIIIFQSSSAGLSEMSQFSDSRLTSLNLTAWFTWHDIFIIFEGWWYKMSDWRFNNDDPFWRASSIAWQCWQLFGPPPNIHWYFWVVWSSWAIWVNKTKLSGFRKLIACQMEDLIPNGFWTLWVLTKCLPW